MCFLAPLYELFAVARLITGTGNMGATLTAFVLSKYCHNMVPQLVFPQDIAPWETEQKVPKSVRWPPFSEADHTWEIMTSYLCQNKGSYY